MHEGWRLRRSVDARVKLREDRGGVEREDDQERAADRHSFCSPSALQSSGIGTAKSLTTRPSCVMPVSSDVANARKLTRAFRYPRTRASTSFSPSEGLYFLPLYKGDLTVSLVVLAPGVPFRQGDND